MGKKKRWECWTLSEEDIDEIIKENDLRKPSKEELEKIVAEFKKMVMNIMADWNWDFILGEVAGSI